jgi:hypothetical protein
MEKGHILSGIAHDLVAGIEQPADTRRQASSAMFSLAGHEPDGLFLASLSIFD